MQATIPLTDTERESTPFAPMPHEAFAARLARAASEAAREFGHHPLAYLRTAFLPEQLNDWLPLRLVRAFGSFAAHPFAAFGGLFRRDRIPVGFINPTSQSSSTFVVNAFAPTTSRVRARDRFVPVLIASGAAHGALIGILVYFTILSMLRPYMDVKIVDHPYRPFEPDVVAELYAPYRKLESQATDKEASLEEIRARDLKRREEAERRKREAEARAKAEAEAKAKAEAEAKTKAEAEEKAKATEDTEGKFGEFNRAPINEFLTELYSLYQSGKIDMNNFQVMVAFKIDCDGSVPRKSMDVKISSGDKKKDDAAQKLLWLLGESHAIGPLCKMSSNTISLDLNEKNTELTITGFAPSADWASQKVFLLKTMFKYLSWKESKSNPDASELFKRVLVTNTNNRIDVVLSISRARASEMMRSRFANTQPQ
jgi:hypothetical protein